MKNIGKVGRGTLVAAAIAMTAPAMAQQMTPQQRARLEADAATQRSITADREAAARALDRAYRAARGIDRVIDSTVARVPGGQAAYRGGMLVGGIAYDQYNRRRP